MQERVSSIVHVPQVLVLVPIVPLIFVTVLYMRVPNVRSVPELRYMITSGRQTPCGKRQRKGRRGAREEVRGYGGRVGDDARVSR